ncbi:arginase [Paenibacillus glycanilyticus]|uniref:arginase n=1 Tax=Paenibacillus glycanilyticus TaxID=126569 RepID=UPI0020420626|nr:arginase [Paenibacillus glycanilyticus]MCM3626456.1 arginase [Paenibacillus glycanilyticus]
MTKPKLSLLSVPFGLGAGNPGSEQAPRHLIRLGLLQRLQQQGCGIIELKEIAASGTHAPPMQVLMKHSTEVIKAGMALAGAVDAAISAGRFPFVLGGDHSLAMGTLAGMTAHFPRLGVIWIDAHADMNTELTSPSGNMHGIPLAVALGRAQLTLSHLLPGAGTVAPGNIVLIGSRDLDPAEEALIRSEGITCYRMADIRRLGITKVIAEALRQAGNETDGIHLSFDIDSIDPSEAPGTGTPVRQGLTSDQAREALRLLALSARLSSAEFVEVNPLLDQADQTAKLAIELIESFLSGLRI